MTSKSLWGVAKPIAKFQLRKDDRMGTLTPSKESDKKTYFKRKNVAHVFRAL